MSPAMEAVISTPELLGHTLAHLPMRDLLVVAPLVSKKWQASTLSPTLQRALYFKPDSTLTGAEPVLNPLLVELFRPFFRPEFVDDEGEDKPWIWPGNAESIQAMLCKAPDAFKRAGASWRRMLVTQPPAQTMDITQTIYHMGGNSERRAVLQDLSLRMGVLYDLLVPFVNDGESFRIRWNNGLDRDTDLTVGLWSMMTCEPDLDRELEERFDCEEGRKVDISFGEWMGGDEYDLQDLYDL